jgi:flagellar biosynthesis protein
MERARYLEAAALGFGAETEGPPQLIAVAREKLAAQMVAIARRYGIPVVEEPDLCGALAELPLDQEIPRELFKAAAVVLARIGVLRR